MFETPHMTHKPNVRSLSYMGCWGHQNLKPTVTFGTAQGPYCCSVRAKAMLARMITKYFISSTEQKNQYAL